MNDSLHELFDVANKVDEMIDIVEGEDGEQKGAIVGDEQDFLMGVQTIVSIIQSM